jgi:ATP-binding cassette, subfamily B, bacterial
MLRAGPAHVLRRYVLHARLLWRAAPGLSLMCLALTALAAGARTAALVTTGHLIAALQTATTDRHGPAAAEATWWLLATSMLFVAGPAATNLLSLAGRTVSARYLVTMCDMAMEAGTHPYGIAHLHDPRSAARLQAVTRAPQDWLFLAGIDATWTLLSIRLGGVGAFLVLARWSWWAPSLLAVGWLVFARAYARWSSTIFDELLEVTGNSRRRAAYLRSLLIGLAAAKEIRLFGLTGWLVHRYAAAWQAAMSAVWANRRRGVRGTLTVLAAPLAANVAVFVVLARDGRDGAVGVGMLVTLVQAVLAMEAFGPQTDPQLGLARTTSIVNQLALMRTELGLPRLPRSLHVGSPPPSPPPQPPSSYPAAAAIDLEAVTFGYPAQEKPTLAGVSLRIPPGQSVALVGVNGAGKSTLVKLLCGLYRPDAGTIRINGLDPGTDENARRQVGVIFQDFVRYPLSLRENVAVGALTYADRQDLLDRALADAGATSVLRQLKQGWETVLSNAYEGGTDLSGGQWQRVALARALAALGGGAGVLVLDEPTSALDVRAEAALFDRFLKVARGATTILVSHRLSSVRRADRIVVLADETGSGARIVEDGTHDQLLASGGRYARLFTLQATRFAAAGADAGAQRR